MTDKIKYIFGGGALALGLLLCAIGLGSVLPVGWAIIGVALLFVGALVAFTEFTKGSVAVIIAVLAVGCAGASAGKPEWWKGSEKISDKIGDAAFKAVPYPEADVLKGGFLERRNQVEKLKRFSDPNKIGYVYIISFGKFVGYYTVKGKISAVNSQLTNGNQVWDSGSGEQGETVVDSIGDDGTFGPNEGGDKGVFFFTTTGTMVVTDESFLYSDQILSIDVPNLVK